MNHAVMISGMGMVSSLGRSVDTFWQGLDRAPEMPKSRPHRQPEKIGKLLYHSYEGEPLEPLETGRATQFAAAAITEALTDAGLLQRSVQVENGTALIVGAGMGHADLYDDDSMPSEDFPIASELAMLFGWSGPTYTLSTACSSSLNALGLAFDLVQSGSVERAICGGTESYNDIAQGCFNRAGVLDSRSCRPFARDRQGTIFGEGAGFVVLERQDRLEERQGRAKAELLAVGMSCDAHHVTIPDPSATAARQAIEACLHHAGLNARSIDLIVPHATGTRVNDTTELHLLQQLFGERLREIPIILTKSHVGHSGASSGIFGLIAAVKAMMEQRLPAHHKEKEDLEYSFLRHKDPSFALQHSLVNAYGFGGSNVSVLVKRVTS